MDSFKKGAFASCVVMLFLSFVGCARFVGISDDGSNYNGQLSLEKQLEGSAIVICRTKNEEKVSRGRYWIFPPVTHFMFENRAGDKFSIDDSENGWSIKRIKPGVYRLSEVSCSVEGTTFYWYDFDYRFCVNSGDIVYINDVSCYPSLRRVNTIDNFEEAKKFLLKKVPDLLKSVYKRKEQL